MFLNLSLRLGASLKKWFYNKILTSSDNKIITSSDNKIIVFKGKKNG